MNLEIKLNFKPSLAFVGVLAELNERFSEWTDGSYDWANQTEDFLRSSVKLPDFDESLYQTPLSRQVVNDLLQVSIALFSGNYPLVRDYLKDIHFAFVIGYPRSGGSYLTKELLRTVGLDHKRVSEALAHDGFPELRDTWYEWQGDRPYFHLQETIFQVAEFLVIAKLYYNTKTARIPEGRWLAPKKFHKMVYWAGSFKMLLGQGRADYLVTVRHPLPTCISIYEKCGGLPPDGLFPAYKTRSAIEHWVLNDLVHLGFSQAAVAKMTYFEAVLASWTQFHTRMATSGLFLGDRHEIRVIPYSKAALESVVQDYRQLAGNALPPESVLEHAKAQLHPNWKVQGDAAVQALSTTWEGLGLQWPELGIS